MGSTGPDQRYVMPEDVQDRIEARLQRNAQTHLPFLLPYLHPGMDVLDAGCGAGNITLDLAPMVTPGRVVGVDFDPAQIEAARRSSAERGLGNAEFDTASVYQLPFDDASFDIVYSNGVFSYLDDPLHALAEMRRVLRPGGMAAAIDDDYSTLAISPDIAEVWLVFRLWERILAHEGGNGRYTRHLRGLMLEAGFARAEGIARSHLFGDPASTRWIAEIVTGAMSASRNAERIVAEGWASREELSAAIAAFRDWGERPDAFLAWLWCGALGWTS